MKKFKEKLQNSTLYGCYFCDKIFQGLSGLQTHLDRRHSEQIKKKEPNQTDSVMAFKTVLLQQTINGMTTNQNLQNQQILELQQQAYLRKLQIEEEELEEEDVKDIEQDERDFDLALYQIRIEQLEKGRQLKDKIQYEDIQYETLNNNMNKNVNETVTYTEAAQPINSVGSFPNTSSIMHTLSPIENQNPFSYMRNMKLDSEVDHITQGYTLNEQNLALRAPERIDANFQQSLMEPPPEELVEEDLEEVHTNRSMVNIDTVSEAQIEKEAQFLNEEKEFFILMKQMKSRQAQKRLPKYDTQIKQFYLTSNFDDDFERHFQKVTKIDFNRLNQLSVEELEAFANKFLPVQQQSVIQKLQKLPTPMMSPSEKTQKQEETQKYSLASEIMKMNQNQYQNHQPQEQKPTIFSKERPPVTRQPSNKQFTKQGSQLSQKENQSQKSEVKPPIKDDSFQMQSNSHPASQNHSEVSMVKKIPNVSDSFNLKKQPIKQQKSFDEFSNSEDPRSFNQSSPGRDEPPYLQNQPQKEVQVFKFQPQPVLQLQPLPKKKELPIHGNLLQNKKPNLRNIHFDYEKDSLADLEESSRKVDDDDEFF